MALSALNFTVRSTRSRGLEERPATAPGWGGRRLNAFALGVGLVAGLVMFAVNSFGATNRWVTRTWRVQDGLPRESVDSITQTPEGYLWLATPAGLVRFDGREFVTSLPFGLGESNSPVAVNTDPKGDLWVLSRGGQLRRRTGGTLVPVQWSVEESIQARGLYTDGVQLMLVTDSNGRIWRWTNERLEPWLAVPSVDSKPFVGINVDRSGTVWARHADLLSWWSGTNWIQLPDPNGKGLFSATKTGAGADGGMWICGQLGVRKFRQGRWDSAEAHFPKRVSAIQCFTEDRSGALWLSTGNDGLWRFDPSGNLEVFTQSDGLASDQVRKVYSDLDDNLWVATTLGLSLIHPRREPGGMANASGISLPAAFSRGVIVEKVLADGALVPVQSSSETNQFLVPSGTKRLELQLSAICFHSPEDLRFRYRMDNLDADWVLAGPDRTAVYLDLPPGRHFLRTAAVLGASGLGLREKTIQLLVQPQLWQTWPFRGGLGLLAGLGVVGIYQWRLSSLNRWRELQRRFAQQLIQSQEAERKRIAAELHDSLGQQLLVIKNNARLGLREPLNAEQLRQQLEAVSQTSSACIDEVRAMAGVLRPYQLDQMGLTKAIRALATQVAQASQLVIHLDLDDLDGLLPSEAEINLYRIVQEGLSNVVRHAQASEVTVHIDHIGLELTASIQDNGCGFRPPSSWGGYGGFGLSNMRERAAVIGGRFEIQSEPGRGTSIRILVPLPRAREVQV